MNQRKTKKSLFTLLIVFMASTLLLLAGCQEKEGIAKVRLSDTSIFSWDDTYMLPENEELVSETMRLLECKTIYQEIPSDTEEDIVIDFLERRNEQNQNVFYLTGAAEWGIEEDAESMISRVDTFLEWNKKAGRNKGFSGIVFDVEPYLTDEWHDDKRDVMERYVDNCIKTYDYAKENNVAIILCIPNFYDSAKQTDELERLVQLGCDAIAVMNYDKTDEWGQISTETGFAQKYEKTIINITELQRPGKHSLEEINTYYNDGLDAVKDSWAKIEEACEYENLGFSYHYLKTAIKLLGLEE